MTDEWAAYRGIGSEFKGGHEVVTHSAGEYARGDAHTNTAKLFFALLKRGVIGSFHHVSKQHLDRYCDEFSFRWDHRSTTDAARTEVAIYRRQANGSPIKALQGIDINGSPAKSLLGRNYIRQEA